MKNIKVLILHNESFVPLLKDVESARDVSCSGTALSISLVALYLNSRNIAVDVRGASSSGNINAIEDSKQYSHVILVSHAIKSYQLFNSAHQKVIFWNHNFIMSQEFTDILSKGGVSHGVCVSDYHAGWLAFKSRSIKVSRIYNPFFSEPSIVKKSAKCSVEKEINLVFSGSVSKNKGFGEFIKVVESVAKHRKVVAKFYGSLTSDFEQQRLNHIKNRIREFNDSSFDYGGMIQRNELYNVMNNSHFLLYGLGEKASETFGYSFLDAQVNNCIPITLNRGGQQETIVTKLKNKTVFNHVNSIVDFLITLDDRVYDEYLYNLNDDFSNYFERFRLPIVGEQWLKILFDEEVDTILALKSIFYFIKINGLKRIYQLKNST